MKVTVVIGTVLVVILSMMLYKADHKPPTTVRPTITYSTPSNNTTELAPTTSTNTHACIVSLTPCSDQVCGGTTHPVATINTGGYTCE